MCDEIEQDAAVLIIDDSVEAKPYTDCNDMTKGILIILKDEV